MLLQEWIFLAIIAELRRFRGWIGTSNKFVSGGVIIDYTLRSVCSILGYLCGKLVHLLLSTQLLELI
jgi:hypothetical protein